MPEPAKEAKETFHGAHISEVEEQNRRLQRLLCELLRKNHELRLKMARHLS